MKLELEQLPDRIAELEDRVSELQSMTMEPGFFSHGHEQYQKVLTELTARETQLEQAMDRWAELETMQQELKSQG